MGYGGIELWKYRHELNNHMGPIPNNYIKIWMADNKGKICHAGNTKGIIGKLALAN